MQDRFDVERDGAGWAIVDTERDEVVGSGYARVVLKWELEELCRLHGMEEEEAKPWIEEKCAIVPEIEVSGLRLGEMIRKTFEEIIERKPLKELHEYLDEELKQQGVEEWRAINPVNSIS